MKEKDFYHLFIEELKDVYDAETRIVKLLPSLIKAAKNKDLKQAFSSHLAETKNQVFRLEMIGKILKIKLSGTPCEAMKGLVKEAQNALKGHYDKDTLDAALISYAQRIEHYEIAAYGVLETFAKHLELKEVESLLRESAKEEGHSDKVLTKIAEGALFKEGVNSKACHRTCACHRKAS